MNSPASTLARRVLALFIFALSLWLWTRHSDVIDLILKQRPVLFGRYSQGRFGALLVLTPILWAIAAAFASRQPLRRALGDATLSIVTTLVAIIAITYIAHFFHRPARYVESSLSTEQAKAMRRAGAVRHRPPNQVYDLTFVDKPEQARSYPNPPPGYHDIPLHLTSDANGFRNLSVLPHYDVLAVGDSFVAGSNVSDDQTWSALLARATGATIYNLGVGGSGPGTYLSNFVFFGLKFQPRVALFMIYEGNDFKENVVREEDEHKPTWKERVAEHFHTAFKSSPVTLGLKRLSEEVFEKLGSTRPVPGYREKLGFMPIAVHSTADGHNEITHYYSFDPRRMTYLNESVAGFSESSEWRGTADILQQIIAVSRQHGIKPVFIYAPSKPHVVLPLVEDAIPADQLRYFAKFRAHHLPPADEFKRELFANLDSEQTVVLDFCKAQGIDCLALTEPLRQATATGTQTYFTYDQHWTPDGQRIAAQTIEQFLREKGYL